MGCIVPSLSNRPYFKRLSSASASLAHLGRCLGAIAAGDVVVLEDVGHLRFLDSGLYAQIVLDVPGQQITDLCMAEYRLFLAGLGG
jgi:hypothetical protein